VSYVFVGALKLDLQILESRSLKEKRMVLRRIKDRVRDRLGLVVAEVGNHELWQRAELGLAAASGDRGKLLELLDAAWRCVAATEGVELLAHWRDLSSFDGELMSGALEADELGDGRELDGDDRSDDARGETGTNDDARCAVGTNDDADGAAGRSSDEAGGGRAGRQANNGAQWTPPEWQRMLDEESR
jgi:uncharacterized protein